MAAKTKSAAAMDEVQARLRPFLEERGYRWRSRTCNRRTIDDLVHVLNFQMGQRSLQGKFTINRRLKQDALPFLARFETRDSILRELTPLKGNTGAGMPNRIVCAILLAHRGEIEAARSMLAAQIREVANPGHAKYVQELSDRLGLGRIES